MNFSRIFFFSLGLILISAFGGCFVKDTDVTQIESISKDNRKSYMFVSQILKSGIFVMHMGDKESGPAILEWLRIGKEDPSKRDLFYKELWEKGLPQKKIFYGPGSIPLVQVSDLNTDGKMDTITYFNSSALTGAQSNNVALKEIDTNGDGKADVWVYPAARLEYDENLDGIADHFIDQSSEIDNAVITLAFELKITELQGKGKKFGNERVWSKSGLPPNAGDRYKPIVGISLPIQ
jgi:hypothetical protein